MTTTPPLDALNAAGTPELLSCEEKLVWILGDLMNATENYFGAENPKRLGHINCAAIRIIDEVLAPAADRIEELEADFNSAAAAASEYSEFWEQHQGDFDQFGNYIPYSQMDGDLRAANARIEVLEKALREIASGYPSPADARLGRLMQIARAALDKEARQ
jgi:hypothetical protein